MELEIENTEVVSANNIQIEAPGSVEVIEGEKDYKVSVVKKEYTIIGDSIFIPSMYEDAPPWLKEFINTTLEVAITNRDQSLIDRMEAILTLMDYVPKNMYTEQINQIVSEDGIINSRIATLNSNLTDAISSTNATVAEINLTYASKNEAAAIATNVLTASLSGNGEIGSALIQLQEAYADLESTTAQSINMLESVMEGEINGNATAMETIRTYVGIDEAGASTGTGLSAYLEGSNGVIGGADSELNNTIKVTAEGVESKFAYNSVVNINGTYKKSGFGLTTNYTSGNGTQANPYVSEFWIDASRLKFTNSAQTGQTAPFTIDATGTTPEITFNGIVNFTNVTNVPTINKTYVQATQPTTGMNLGDTWIDTDDNNSLYSYNGTTWNKTQSGNKTFLQATAPTTGMITGDIWVDSDANYKQYRYSGSDWVEYLYNPATAINTGTTTINGPKITTGSITAVQIAANSVSADKLIAGTNSSTVWTGGGLISQNFNGNPYGNIGTPSTGFRLSSGAAGTSTDPNIYGAYIQGSSVEVNSFKVRAEGYASNFGRLNLVSDSTAIVGRGYSTGFDARRVCSNSVSSIKLDCWARATGNWISAVLEYESNSNGSWILVADRGMSMYGYSEYAYLNFAEFFNPSLVPTTGYVHFRIRLTSGNSGSTSGVVVTLSNG